MITAEQIAELERLRACGQDDHYHEYTAALRNAAVPLLYAARKLLEIREVCESCETAPEFVQRILKIIGE